MSTEDLLDDELLDYLMTGQRKTDTTNSTGPPHTALTQNALHDINIHIETFMNASRRSEDCTQMLNTALLDIEEILRREKSNGSLVDIKSFTGDMVNYLDTKRNEAPQLDDLYGAKSDINSYNALVVQFVKMQDMARDLSVAYEKNKETTDSMMKLLLEFEKQKMTPGNRSDRKRRREDPTADIPSTSTPSTTGLYFVCIYCGITSMKRNESIRNHYEKHSKTRGTRESYEDYYQKGKAEAGRSSHK